jgi:hypothetical protein
MKKSRRIVLFVSSFFVLCTDRFGRSYVWILVLSLPWTSTATMNDQAPTNRSRSVKAEHCRVQSCTSSPVLISLLEQYSPVLLHINMVLYCNVVQNSTVLYWPCPAGTLLESTCASLTSPTFTEAKRLKNYDRADSSDLQLVSRVNSYPTDNLDWEERMLKVQQSSGETKSPDHLEQLLAVLLRWYFSSVK